MECAPCAHIYMTGMREREIKVGASGFYPHFVLLVSINRKIIELK